MKMRQTTSGARRLAAVTITTMLTASAGAGASGAQTAGAALGETRASVANGSAQAGTAGSRVLRDRLVSGIDRTPRHAWLAQDAADSLYRAARRALNRGEYAEAARLFDRVARGYPESGYAPDALYWKALSLYQGSEGESDALRRAVRALEEQERRYPDARTRSDARSLALRIRGKLARTGDEAAAAAVAEAGSLVASEAPSARAAREAERTRVASEAPRSRAGQDDCPETELQVTALHALSQMDAEKTIPILEKVLGRRDPCSEELRRKAMFLLAQQEGGRATEILLKAVREDPDPEVRRQAVFWLSQVEDDRALEALIEIVQSAEDPELRKRAVFALSQHESPEAGRIMREFAEDPSESNEIRSHAIMWLGKREGEARGRYLRELFDRLEEPKLKERVLFAMAQSEEPADAEWLIDVARRKDLTMEARRMALFWAGQAEGMEEELVAMYDDVESRELKEQLVFVYSRMDAPEAMDRLIDLARTEEDPELRKKIIFWLGQSDDPRAVEILQEIIGG